jgi:ATP-dependent helicase/nuclease subunit B
MPHSSAQSDAELSRSVTDRLLHSAPDVRFSYAELRGKAESKPSHMVGVVAGKPGSLPTELVPDILPDRQTVEYIDGSTVPYAATKAEGGSSTLSMQSNCAFHAFATIRLDAKSWEPAETGLNPRQRGDLVHAVLHSIWGGEKHGGWRSSDELKALLDSDGRDGLATFVRAHVDVAMKTLPVTIRDRMPELYLTIEA